MRRSRAELDSGLEIPRAATSLSAEHQRRATIIPKVGRRWFRRIPAITDFRAGATINGLAALTAGSNTCGHHQAQRPSTRSNLKR
jgi:hypothetical protein